MPADGFMLRLLTPEAEEDEIAALVVVLAAAAAPTASVESTERPRSQWASPDRLLRVTHPSGPGGWRASGLPR